MTEVWIWYFLMDNRLRNLALGSNILKHIMNHFTSRYGFDCFLHIVTRRYGLVKFWKKNNYEIIRISKNFFNISSKGVDLIIFKNK